MKYLRLFLNLCLIFSPLNAAEGNYLYELSLCAIFRNEAPYLKEWIEFHKLVGVQHFYLINHLSNDDYKQVLAPYIASGEVELFECQSPLTDAYGFMRIVQPEEYTKIVRLAEGKTKWLAIIDSDEFLFPVESFSLLDFLKDYEDYGGVYVFWQMFGTSFVPKKPDDKLQIETFIWQSEKDYFYNKWGKSIVRPERVKCADIHFSCYKPPYFHVFTDKTEIEDFDRFCLDPEFIPNFKVDVSKARINHYWTRDEDYAMRAKLPRYENWYGQQEFFSRIDNLNIELNYQIFKYVYKLRKQMGLD